MGVFNFNDAGPPVASGPGFVNKGPNPGGKSAHDISSSNPWKTFCVTSPKPVKTCKKHFYHLKTSSKTCPKRCSITKRLL